MSCSISGSRRSNGCDDRSDRENGLRTLHLLSRVLFVALRGRYRSSLTPDPTSYPVFRRARCTAYQQLWAKLENIYWKLRGCNGDTPTLRGLLRDVNAFLAENRLYILGSDQELLTLYILSLQRLKVAVWPLPNKASAAWESTAQLMATRFVNVNTITREVAELRNRVLQQIRHAISSV